MDPRFVHAEPTAQVYMDDSAKIFTFFGAAATRMVLFIQIIHTHYLLSFPFPLSRSHSLPLSPTLSFAPSLRPLFSSFNSRAFSRGSITTSSSSFFRFHSKSLPNRSLAKLSACDIQPAS